MKKIRLVVIILLLMFFCVDNVMAGDKACSTWGNKGASVCNSKTYKGYKCKWDGNRKGAARCYKSSNLANEIKVNITSCDQIKDSSTCQSSKVNGQECIWKQGACRNNASDGSNDTIIADDQNDREEQDEYLDEYDNDKDSSTNPNINELSKCDSLLGDPNQKPNGSTPGSPAFYLNVIFSVLRYVAIAILFVLSVMDFLQATAAHDDDAIKKATSKTIKRVVICVIIFVLPTLIEFILQFIHDKAIDTCGIGGV